MNRHGGVIPSSNHPQKPASQKRDYRARHRPQLREIGDFAVYKLRCPKRGESGRISGHNPRRQAMCNLTCENIDARYVCDVSKQLLQHLGPTAKRNMGAHPRRRRFQRSGERSGSVCCVAEHCHCIHVEREVAKPRQG